MVHHELPPTSDVAKRSLSKRINQLPPWRASGSGLRTLCTAWPPRQSFHEGSLVLCFSLLEIWGFCPFLPERELSAYIIIAGDLMLEVSCIYVGCS